MEILHMPVRDTSIINKMHIIELVWYIPALVATSADSVPSSYLVRNRNYSAILATLQITSYALGV